MTNISTLGIGLVITGLICIAIYFLFVKKKNLNSDQNLSQSIETAELKEKLRLLEKEKRSLEVAIKEKTEILDSYSIDFEKKNQKISENLLAIDLCKTNEYIAEDKEKDNSHVSDSQEFLSLKNRFSKLEEENEELNDDYVNLTKKITRKNDEFEELEIKLSDLEKNHEQLESIKLELENTNTEIKTQLEEKQNSLGFVNGILNATSSNSRDFEEISNKTWDIFSFISNNSEVIELNDDDTNEAWQWVNNEKKTWLKNKTTIAIVGEFSAGKTTIVNTILKANDPQAVLLPTNSKETTAIPTYISNGKDFNCEFYTPDGDLKIVSTEIFQNVTKTALDNVNVSSLIKYFVLKYPNKNLENISILDTPGFGSNDQMIINRTTEVIKETDALFWVMDINQGDLNESSLKVINEHLGDIPLFVILNKSDTKSKIDQDIAKVKIVKTLNDKKIKYNNIIAFSDKENPNVILDLIKELKKAPTTSIIVKIDNNLKKSITILKKELNDLLKNEKEFSDNCDIIEENFKIISSNIKFNITEAIELFQHSTPLIGKNSYKIIETDKNQFDYYIDSAQKDLDEYPKEIDTYLYYNNELKFVINKKSEIKGEIKYYEELLKTFTSLVNQYDPKLLKAQ